MPDSEPLTMGEVRRTLLKMDATIDRLSERVVTKSELDLHFKGLRQQFEAIDNRHTILARELEEDRAERASLTSKQETDKKARENEKRNLRSAVIICVLAAVLAYLSPLLSPWA